jgi:hypothetical protein
MAMAKIGEGHVRGMAELGLNEIRNGVYPESNIAEKHPPYGVWGHPTPGEIADARRDDGRGLEIDHSSSSVVGDRLEQASGRAERREGPSEDRGMEME